MLFDNSRRAELPTWRPSELEGRDPRLVRVLMWYLWAVMASWWSFH